MSALSSTTPHFVCTWRAPIEIHPGRGRSLHPGGGGGAEARLRASGAGRVVRVRGELRVHPSTVQIHSVSTAILVMSGHLTTVWL